MGARTIAMTPQDALLRRRVSRVLGAWIAALRLRLQGGPLHRALRAPLRRPHAAGTKSAAGQNAAGHLARARFSQPEGILPARVVPPQKETNPHQRGNIQKERAENDLPEITLNLWARPW